MYDENSQNSEDTDGVTTPITVGEKLMMFDRLHLELILFS